MGSKSAQNPNQTAVNPTKEQAKPKIFLSQLLKDKSKELGRELTDRESKDIRNTYRRVKNRKSNPRIKDYVSGVVKHSQLGRPTKYKPIFCKKVIEYFDTDYYEVVQVTHTNKKGESWSKEERRALPPPTLEGFSNLVLGVATQQLYKWAEVIPDFREALTRAREIQLNKIAVCTMLGLYNPQFAMFMTKNVSKWRDKKDIEHSGKIDSTLFMNDMVSKAEQAEADEIAVFNRN